MSDLSNLPAEEIFRLLESNNPDVVGEIQVTRPAQLIGNSKNIALLPAETDSREPVGDSGGLAGERPVRLLRQHRLHRWHEAAEQREGAARQAALRPAG